MKDGKCGNHGVENLLNTLKDGKPPSKKNGGSNKKGKNAEAPLLLVILGGKPGGKHAR